MSQELQSVWLLLDSRAMGGIESHVAQLAEALVGADIAVEVLFLQDHGSHPLKQRLSTAGIKWSVLSGTLTSLLRRLKKDRPTILHTHGYKSGILGRVAARLQGIAVASTYHAGEIGRGRMSAYDFIDCWTGFLAHSRIAVSQAIAERIPSKANVIDNFVRLPSSPSTGDQIAFVGRLSEEKAPDLFVELAARLPTEQFHIYGDGPMRDSLMDGAPANVMFHGVQAEMESVWPRIGLLIMPSRHEGLPMAALEAMSHGIPVAASAVGGLPNLIAEQQNGYLYRVGDLDALENCIRAWRSNAETRSFLSANALGTIETRFSPRAVLPKILDQYRQAAAA
jgi:glycosyltransferase involved in cell wall biosynthesis